LQRSARAPEPEPPRSALVAALSARLSREGAPRIQMLVIVALAGATGFLVSTVGVSAGLDSMALRYPLAALLGYLSFVALLRLWVAWQRGRLDPADLAVDAGLPGRPGEGADLDPGAGSGGEAGGGGAGRSWDAQGPMQEPAGEEAAECGGAWARADSPAADVAEAAGGSLDADELWLAVLALALALGGLCAAAYVIYTAPLLLAELALDAALVSAVYRRVRRRDARHWSRGVLRRTWLPALLLVASFWLVGLALSSAAPEARSVGEALAALRG
jgi:hypothetical protein